jgi:phosphohistidine phosphatase
MAQQLWLLRHGEAEPHDARPDADRRLTDRGREQSRVAGRALAALKVQVHLAFTSPKVRARDTAVLACEALGIEPIDHAALFAGFDVAVALQLLGAAGPEQRVLVVGHEPDFSQVVYDLTGARIDFKKGGVAAVRVSGGRGELIALLRPRELESLALTTLPGG